MKPIIFILCAMVFFGACVTQKRCAEKFPPVSHTDTIEHIVWIDTTVYLYLPGDTIVDSMYLVPIWDNPLQIRKLKIDSRYSSATSWVRDSKLYMELINNDTLIAYVIDSIAETKTKTITVTNEHIKPVKFVPLIYKVALIVAIGFLIFAILRIVVTLFR
jgi:hypothetical protein